MEHDNVIGKGEIFGFQGSRFLFWQWTYTVFATLLLCSCGSGGGAAGQKWTATSGVAQKGPLILGSTVTAQELNAAFSPNGRQYSYQITSDLGTFSPSSPFSSQYVGLTATGYYFDEVANNVSGGPISLNGSNDLSTDTVLNVNLLTTLEYQRIQNLVTKSGLSFSSARAQAEQEVLAAFHIPPGSYGAFGTLDISRGTDGDKILAAISCLFVYGNGAGSLAALIAKAQSDFGTNGKITDATTLATLAASAKALDPAAVAANLTSRYSSSGVSFTATDIANWIDSRGDGVVGVAGFRVPYAGPSTSFALPASLTDSYAGTKISVSAGQLTVNGQATSTATLAKGDVVTVSPPIGLFGGTLTIYLVSGATNIARVTFVATLTSIHVTTATTSLPLGTTQALQAIGTYADGTMTDVTMSSSWSSMDPAIIAVGAATGVASAVSVGQTTVTAAIGSVSGAMPLTVTAAVLASISVGPNPFKTGVGIARHMKATGVLSDGSLTDLTSTAAWSSGNVATAVVASGVVSGVAIGSTSITASSGSVQGSATLNVTANGWGIISPMNLGRAYNTPVLLHNGKVLVAGGRTSTGQQTASAEIYDPSADTWTLVASMANARENPATVVLPNGKVLVAGGYAIVGGAGSDSILAEIYDPSTDTWNAAASLQSPHTAPAAAILLPNGKVLVAGGSSSGALVGSTELYDPTSNSWVSVGSIATPRRYNGGGLLGNGTVIIVGGVDAGNAALSSAEIFDLSIGAWASAAAMSTPRDGFQSSVLANGRILVIGGMYDTNPSNYLGSCETYDPAMNVWNFTDALITPRSWASSVLLNNGKVLVAGGWIVAQYLPNGELYDPATGTWSAAGTMNLANQITSMVALPNGAAVVIEGTDISNNVLNSVEIFWP
jgi:N-acetylneuraminic acid mutarotase